MLFVVAFDDFIIFFASSQVAQASISANENESL
jgi:hypothetical protein